MKRPFHTVLLQGLSLSLIAGLLASCDVFGGDDDPEVDTSVLLPLAVGNYWAYQTTWLDGAITDSSTVEITRRMPVTYEGEALTAFAESVRFNGLPPPEYEWLRGNGEGGLYMMGGIADTDTLVLRKLDRKYPAREGETWSAVRLVYRLSSTREFGVQDTVVVSLESTEEPIETPAGRFKCHVYKYSFRPANDVLEKWDVFEYYTPGVGLVKEVIRGQSDGRLLYDTVLYNYRVQ